ncbi:MAG: hypothetical protein ACXWC4_04690 [Telluria sp.]
MTRTLSSPKWIAAVALAGLTGVASATLPAPSPAAAQAAAAKKAAADAQAAKDKQELLASEDAVASRWRSRAAAQGWHTNPAVAVAPAPATSSATGNAPAGQPGGKLAPATQAAPIKSEKLGTAAPSADVKKKP